MNVPSFYIDIRSNEADCYARSRSTHSFLIIMHSKLSNKIYRGTDSGMFAAGSLLYTTFFHSFSYFRPKLKLLKPEYNPLFFFFF